MKINFNLLPIKLHYFLFQAGTAPLVPYLSTYARQLGFSSATVGLIYTILPIFGLIAKPLFGVIADRFKIQKSIFIIFQIITIVSFGSIYFIPQNQVGTIIQLDCVNGKTVLKSCKENVTVDECKLSTLQSTANQNEVALCEMNCDISSPKMWQTVCEHWRIPQYCYNSVDSLKYLSHIGNITVRDSCAFIETNDIILDGHKYTPHCRSGSGFVNINQPCSLNCTDQTLTNIMTFFKTDMICLDNELFYRFCIGENAHMSVSEDVVENECTAACELVEPWQIKEICDSLQANVASACQPKLRFGEGFPTNLSFTGTVFPYTVISKDDCLYVQLNHITLPDGSIHHPTCASPAVYQLETELFHASCQINCNNSLLNEMLESVSESVNQNMQTQYTTEFWLFFLFMIINWVGQAVVVTFADAICFHLLGDKIAHYGKQRLWGSVGWGIFSLTTGALIDLFSEGATKNYAIAFILMFVFMSGDVVVSCFVKTDTRKMSINILADVGTLLSSLPTFIFILWVIAVGFCTGLIWQFLFWYLEDIAALTCDGSERIKTLQGLVNAIQTFGGEIPFLFVSGYILRKVGHVKMMSLVLFAFGIRFLLYSILTNPWWALPIEILQGITYGMIYPIMTCYANAVAPAGAETTVQGLVGAVFEGVGTSLGSLVGGQLYKYHGGSTTFRWFGIGALVFCFLHIFVQYLLKDKIQHNFITSGYTSTMHFQKPNDTVSMLEQNREEDRE
ncbi:major facilitator superfamily domain-containing protein 6-like [Galleria mellonella]|uniref:Major facilitator superfamily domain-containing protein 6-like n=1 Tax=Galleria mellonella TaxID=7137 RepID=A0ABM3MN46_GALME|nr:major facilitator superfamily domain-containing protein 6-like [Galleria mellonella]